MPAPGEIVEAPVETPRFRTTARRGVFWIVIAVVATLFAIISIGLTASSVPDTGRYSIENAGPTGSRALAEVLRQQGVDVVRADSLDEAKSAVDAAQSSGGQATLLFSDPYGYLDGSRLDELADLDTDVVLLEPGTAELDSFAPDIATAGAAETADEVAAQCDLPAAVRAGSISQPTSTYRVISTDPDTTVSECFPSYGDSFAVITSESGAGSVGTAGTTVTAYGAGDSLTNDVITKSGNAALALGVLGANPTLVWYLPTGADLTADGSPVPTLGDLTPGWVTPVILLLIVTVIAAGIWRGRRFGPVVVENLPVTVRASETMEGRARLYARQSAYGRALDALRIGTIARLTGLLGLPRHASVLEVSRTVSSLTGLPVDQVHDTLVGAVPQSESDLLALSDRLLLLEQQVERARRP
ncbi:DUF4350 domain-containing protein [Herbiconiux solani]|uniref:DUF4350 domain-containing protein n=1 Tax=Herbiconiux solani TaxID=661329 RepID=UPI000824C42C|nr:DUF4350 domain-containing protein [Herbiconiux solani]